MIENDAFRLSFEWFNTGEPLIGDEISFIALKSEMSLIEILSSLKALKKVE